MQIGSSASELTRRTILVATGAVTGVASSLGWSAQAFGSGSSSIANAVTAAAAVSNTVASPISFVDISITVNGIQHQVHVDSRISLLDLLREQLLMSGTKKGCNQGACGACTVLLGGQRINSCLTLAVMHNGASLTTIEGLADAGSLHPLQAAFVEFDAFQCGYCTSGQIMSGVACIAEGHGSSMAEVQNWMSGNICRCGAYPGICSAIVQTAKQLLKA